MIQITLNIRGMKPHTYKADIRMRESLDAYGLADRWEKAIASGEYPRELVEEALTFICRCFQNQFSVDELLDGYEGNPYGMVLQFLSAVIQFNQELLTDFPPKAATTTGPV